MTQYINKATVIAEIEKRINGINPDTIEDWRYRIQWEHDIEVMKNILSLINTLEVKEVELEEEINHWQGCEAFPEDVNITPLPKAMEIVERTARHFFELGLKAAQNTN